MSDNSCMEFENRIHELMDRRQPVYDDQQLVRHAANCVVCNSLLRDFARVDAVLSSRDSNNDIGLFDSGNYPAFVDPVTLSKPVSRKNSFERLGVWSAIASMMLVALTAGFIWQQRGNDSPVAVSTSSQAPGAELISLDADEPLAVQEYVSTPVSSRSSKRVEVPVDKPESEIMGSSLVGIEWAFADPFQPYDSLYSELPGIHPIRSSLNATFDYLQKAFQGNDEPQEKPADADDGGSDGGAFLCYQSLCRLT